MEITYYNQFDNEPIEQIPDPKKEYYFNNIYTATGFTYLFKLLWLINKNPSLIEKLPEYMRDISVKIGGMTTLHYVCEYNQSDKLPEVIELLIKNGTDVNAKNIINNWTALHFVCSNYQSYKLPEVIELLIKNGADVNSKTNYNHTALHYVCSDYQLDKLPEVIELLIKYGANVNAKTTDDYTALHFVCKFYQSDKLPEVIKLLIKYGADVDAKNDRSYTALWCVCKYYQSDKLPEVVELLIKYGSDVNAKNDNNNTALQYVCKYHQADKLPEVVELLIKSCPILDIESIIKSNTHEIYGAIIKYHKHASRKIKPFLQYLNKEEIKLLNCFAKFKTSIQSVNDVYNQIYYYPHNIGALLCESNFYIKMVQPYNSNKLQFLFNSKN